MERSVLLRRTVGTGLVGGIAVVYLAAVGMIEQFNVRNLISDIVTLGKVMVCLPPFLAGYLAVRPRVRHGSVQRPTARMFLWLRQRATVRERLESMRTSGQRGIQVLGILVALVILAALPSLVGTEISNTLGTVAIFVLMGLGLNVVVGFAGLLDLGY